MLPRSAVQGTAATITLALIALWSSGLAAGATVREQVKNRVVDTAATDLVNKIQNQSCAEFAQTLKQAKSGGVSSSKKAAGFLKNDPAARSRFIDKVAGPLVNKMIDCDLLPGM